MLLVTITNRQNIFKDVKSALCGYIGCNLGYVVFELIRFSLAAVQKITLFNFWFRL